MIRGKRDAVEFAVGAVGVDPRLDESLVVSLVRELNREVANIQGGGCM